MAGRLRNQAAPVNITTFGTVGVYSAGSPLIRSADERKLVEDG